MKDIVERLPIHLAADEIEKLREALEQALDDMGPDDRFGLCVCAETKDMMRAALGHQQTAPRSDE